MDRRAFLKSCLAGVTSVSIAGCGSAFNNSGTVKKPNVLLILADDMGYSDLECYGGDVKTPNLSALADGGLQFTQHYSTGRCWPSRACILTGYYAQQIKRDWVGDMKMGNRPSWAKLLPEMLKPYGYKSYHSGKWHIDRTPKEGGFDRSWGSLRQDCDEDRFFNASIWQEDDLVAPVKKGDKYYTTVAIADHAIACLDLHNKNTPADPFFQYVAFYSPHFPLQAMQKDIDKYTDAYIDGWDVIRQRRWQKMKKMELIDCPLSERDADTIPHWNLKEDKLAEKIDTGEAGKAVAWDTLTDEQKKFQANKMAIHAAMITRMDIEIGRIIKRLKDMGEYENTLILFASDNGASAEQIIRGDDHDKTAPMGSAKSYLCLGPGWSTASNTPFRLHKHWNHEGGISSPFIAHWPKGIKAKGKLRHEPSHFIDVVPTVLEAASGQRVANNYTSESAPKRPGHSLIPNFKKDSTVKHDCIWWFHRGNAALRMGDWKISAAGSGKKTKAKWELYNLKNDRCEMNDLAQKHPEKLKELQTRWNHLAKQYEQNAKIK
jgi:arylsulfatase A-like enzyme